MSEILRRKAASVLIHWRSRQTKRPLCCRTILVLERPDYCTTDLILQTWSCQIWCFICHNYVLFWLTIPYSTIIPPFLIENVYPALLNIRTMEPFVKKCEGLIINVCLLACFFFGLIFFKNIFGEVM